MKHFLLNKWDRTQAAKRGAGCHFVSWESLEPDQQASLEAMPGAAPDRVYERQWSLTLLGQVFRRLRQECMAAGKGNLFGALSHYLSGEADATSYAEAGQRLLMSA